MGASKTFSPVTESVFSCVKATSSEEHGTVYDPPNGDQGTATTSTPVGDVVLSFDLQVPNLTYTILKKPFIVPDSTIWDGIQSTIDSCQSTAGAAAGNETEAARA